MFKRSWLLLIIILLTAVNGFASKEELPTLRVYGPGGPHHVMAECAQLFRERHGIQVEVIHHNLEQRARDDADLYYGGAEYMLDDFNRKNPGLLDLESLEKLHPRQIGIIVRKGNPLQIEEIEDLQLEGVDLLDVRLENMGDFHSRISGERSRIRQFAYTGQQGVDKWLAHPEVDAWVTYRSWHMKLQKEADFIAIPGEEGLRYTPIAMTSSTTKRAHAEQFISFLKSDEARQLFMEHGWY